jgi:hypothetical protein
MTLELTCRRVSGRAVLSIEGWMEGDPHELSRLFEGDMLDLSNLDPRLKGSAVIPGVTLGATRCALKGSGAVEVEGRALEEGDRVRITTGGPIA